MKENLLFVCSRNQWRSPTAEGLFRNHLAYDARSAGTSEKARTKLSHKLVAWADVIIVMERRHRDIVRERYGAELAGKRLVVLDIEDHYGIQRPRTGGTAPGETGRHVGHSTVKPPVYETHLTDPHPRVVPAARGAHAGAGTRETARGGQRASRLLPEDETPVQIRKPEAFQQ
jgi:predicted protein tyrosine phosphatase